MSNQRIISDKLPKQLDPYSHASYVNGWLYASGQLPIDLYRVVYPHTIGDQTHQAFANLSRPYWLKGMTFDHVIERPSFSMTYFRLRDSQWGLWPIL